MSNPPSKNFPPFLVVRQDDHSAWIVIATALGMACVLIFTTARIVVRYMTASGSGLDDHFHVFSVVLAVIQSSVLLFGCSLGLGASMTHITQGKQKEIQKVYYTSILLWILSLGLSKISVAALFKRINVDSRRNFVYNGTTAVIGAWTLASFLAMALQCDFAHPWITLHQRCENVSLRWKVINALDIATEVMLLATAVFLVWSLQTSVTRKVTVVTGFACRLPIIIAIGFRLGTFDQAGLTTDPSLRETLFIVWTQTELNYSLISASNPSLLQFMRNLNTHFGGVTERENATYGSHKSSSHSFPMSILRSGNKTNASQNRSHTHTGENDDVNGYGISRAKAPALKNKGSVGSGDSQKYIIQKDISYTVEYE